MNRYFVLPGIVLVLFVIFYGWGCSKTGSMMSTCHDLAPSADSTALKAFAASNGINATMDTSGLFYQILDSGTTVHPTTSSTIYVTYTAQLLNGAIFDSTSNPNKTGFYVGSLIKGWQIGITKIGTGGHIKLLVPSAYGYGCSGYLSIPSNAPLFFDITLAGFQ